MGEGAWSVWEPEEGHYDFALFDRALELCQKHELKAIMGTPTYTPPAWLTERYPEVLRTRFDGTPLVHGSRRHYNYTSPVYREKSRAITEALAQHYQTHPAVIGWQIDNELNCHLDVSFATSDHDAFRVWCQERYRTLDALNQAWGTAFWSQTHSNLSESEPAFGLFSVHLRYDDSVCSNAAPDYQANRATPIRDPQRLSNHD
jgi:beta-galactosidase